MNSSSEPRPGVPILRIAAMMAVLLLACADPGGEDPPPTSPERSNGTSRMVERLRRAAVTADREFAEFHSDTRVAAIRSQAPGPGVVERLNYNALLAWELQHAGQLAEAIATYSSMRTLTDDHRSEVPDDFAAATLELLAVSHLHRSFEQNCDERREVEPCIFPVGADGTHEPAADSRAAIEVYEALLRQRPDDLRSRWLLNLAYMNVGEYPEGVPAEYLIPASAFAPEEDAGLFHDVAPALGMDVLGRSGGAVMDDFDGDGLLDVFTSSWGIRDPASFFRNNGDGTFADRSLEAGLEGLTGGLNTKQADFDNDGDIDVLVLRGAWMPRGEPNSLLRNRGDGRFEDVTEAAGLMDPPHPTQTAAWGDFDNDGLLDLFIGNESTEDKNTDPAQLFRNNGDGTFTNVADRAGVAIVGFIKGVTEGDYDNDGLLDLYVSRLGQPNLLLHNEGPGDDGIPRFVDVAEEAGVLEPVNSFPTWFFDFDNDGWLDLFVSGYWSEPGEVAREYLGLPLLSGTPRLYRNRGDGTFEDRTRRARMERVLETMGSNFGDIDNDGYPDVYVGTGDPDFRSVMPSRMFRNDGGEAFREVTTAGGFGFLAKGHGVAFGDADNDGDQDIYVNLGGAYRGDQFRNVFLANPGHGKAWVTLRLEGVRSNRSAIGARVRVEVDGPDGVRTIHSTVGSGGSFGASSLQQEIGLGDATSIREIEVWWPTTGQRDVYRNVPTNRIYGIREGAPSPEPLELGTFDLGTVAGGAPR